MTRIIAAVSSFLGTMSEIEKALAELKALMKYREDQLGHKEDFRGLGLTSRKNLCLHPSVKREKSGAVVDARCRSLTAGFVKEKKERGEDVPVCIYHDVCLSSTIRDIWLTTVEPGPVGASQSHSKRCLDARWYYEIWRRTQAMPVFYIETDGRWVGLG
jgi:Rad3-related DNA helicase